MANKKFIEFLDSQLILKSREKGSVLSQTGFQKNWVDDDTSLKMLGQTVKPKSSSQERSKL